MADLSPFEQLVSYEERGRRHVVNFATEEDRRDYWRAVSFRVGKVQLLVDERNVYGLLTLPEITIVPGTRKWMMGVANVRGELLPIVNFGDFLFNIATERSKHSLILVVQFQEVRSGLIIDQAYGVRRFPVDARTDIQMTDMLEPLKSVLSGSFEKEGTVFHAMEVEKLINETGFMQAAA